ncbi:MAG: secretin N-terminal domain-containing protein [Candidatus Zapsychrus exili]|nr:secretin N-terminal domain-containing protein [Candidatus Zapsychrus exili]
MNRKIIYILIFLFLLLELGQNSSAAISGDSNIDSSTIEILDLKAIDVADVLKLISQKSGLNIIAGQNVKGKVTVYLKDIDALDALKIIVDAYDWAYEIEDNVVKLMTASDYESKRGYKFGQETNTRIKQLLFAKSSDLLNVLNQIKSPTGKVVSDEKSNTLVLMDQEKKLDEMEAVIERMDVPIETEIFDLSYAKAEDAAGKIQEILTPSVGTMRFDARSNKIVVSDTSSKIAEVAKILSAFDQRGKQVLIEAKILQITLSDSHKMGVDWRAILADHDNLYMRSDFDILSATDKAGKLSIGTIDNLDVLIEALDIVGDTNILSSSRITTINNEEAKILVGSTEPYVTSTTTTPASGPTTVSKSVNFIEVGVKLYVTPTIHNDGFITMKIRPEVSSVVDNITTSNNNTIPVVETSEAEINVFVKNGVTIVIGGLMKDTTIKTTKRGSYFRGIFLY